MFIVVLILVFVGFGLILVASLTGAAAWAWVSVGVSVVAAALLLVDWARRWTGIGDGDRIGLPDYGSSAVTESSTSPVRSDPEEQDQVTETFASVPVDADNGTATPTVESPDREGDTVKEPETSSDAPQTDTSEPGEARTELSEPGEERTDPSALAVLAGLEDEVRVIDEQPRFHLADCVSLAGRESVTLAAKDAVDCEFTPCATCTPVRVLTGSGAHDSKQRA